MEKNLKSDRYWLKKLAEVSDIFDSLGFYNDNVEVTIVLNKDKYDSILKNFRQIEWNREEFSIEIDNTVYKFILKK